VKSGVNTQKMRILSELLTCDGNADGISTACWRFSMKDSTIASKRAGRIALLLSLVLVCALVSSANVRYTTSDPRGTLLLSDSLVFHGSFTLEHYGREILDPYGYTIHNKNGHDYYFFPIGTSLASIPAVAGAKLLGYSYVQHEEQLQIFLACITAALTLLFLTRLASLFLTPLNAVLASLVFWLGTALASTGGTALWSHNFATLFGLMAIYYAIKSIVSGTAVPWLGIGLLLFFAYLCRPTLALLAPFLLLWMFFHDKRAATLSAVTLMLVFAAFIGWSFVEFGQPLPDYYLPKRLSGANFAEALVGNLISPARGLLVYSPFIALAWLYRLAAGWRRISLTPWWLLIGLGWPLLHLIFISRFPHWWAGWAFGARFMMDVLPGLFLLTVLAWPRDMKEVKASGKTAGALVFGCVFSLYVNTVQGLYNTDTIKWNKEPSVDFFPSYLFDWRYPPFLHDDLRHQERIEDHEFQLGIRDAKIIIYQQQDSVRFQGWSYSEPTHRWNDGKSAAITFFVPASIKPEGTITIMAMYFDEQRIRVNLNGVELGRYNSKDIKISQKVHFDPEQLLVGQLNTLTFELPDAKPLGTQDPRVMGMGLKYIAIQ